MAKVTAKNIFSLADGNYTVAPNLIFRVRGKSRSFVLRYSIGGKRKDKQLGSASKMTITEAKQMAEKFRVGLQEGVLPVTPKEVLVEEVIPDLNPTFESYSIKTIDKIAAVRMWKNAKHRYQWYATVKDIAIPVLGKKKMNEITRQAVLDVLKPIWLTRNETASRLRGRLENIFSYAVSDGLMEFNPALWRGNLDRELPPPSKVQTTGHLEAMPLEELQEKIHCFLPPKNRTRQVILFTILTASRVGESAPARWEEIDWENKIWSVPPERRKDQKKYPHRVPLSRQAIELLKGIERKGELIFCIDASNQGSKYSLRPLLQKMTGTKATMHGFRSTFRDWCAENGINDTVAEKCLMHSTGSSVVQAYQRSDLLAQRRQVMQAWADTVFSKCGSLSVHL